MRSGEFPEVASVALTILGTLLLAVSLAFAHLRLDGFGLVGSLPLTYYVGLACLPLASSLLWTRQRGAAILVAGLLIFVLFVWLTPLVLEGEPRFRTSYLSYGYVDPIVRGQGLQPDRFFYHNWPLFPLLFGGIVSAVHLQPLVLMGWFPAVIMLLYLAPLAGLLRLTTGPIRERVPQAWAAGLWLFLVFDWTGQDYFSPQALSYLMFLGWAWLLAWVALRRDGQFARRHVAVAIALYGLIVLTHVLTALLALGALAALTMAGMLRRPSLIVTTAVMFVGWQVYVAAPFFAFYGPHLVQALLAAQDFLLLNLTNRIAGAPEHETVATLRVVAAILAFGIGALGAARFLRDRPIPRETRFAIVFLLGIAIIAPVSVYGGEMLIRILLFSLPMLAVLTLRAFDAAPIRTVLAASLLVAAPLHMVTHYGNELYDYVSPGEVTGYELIAERLAPANIYGAYPAGVFLRSATLDSRNVFPPTASTQLALNAFRDPARAAWLHRTWPIYVAVSRGDDAAATLFYNDPTFVERLLAQLAREPDRFRLVYRNPDIAIYRWVGPPPVK
ncbi:MAG TPA: hypothetical protein VF802_03275 [Candidatus Limnocylindrales bacterium]